MSLENTLIPPVDISQEKQDTFLDLLHLRSEGQVAQSGQPGDLHRVLFLSNLSLMRKFVLQFARRPFLKAHSLQILKTNKLKSLKQNQLKKRNPLRKQRDLQKKTNNKSAKKNQSRKSNRRRHKRSLQERNSPLSTQKDPLKRSSHRSNQPQKISLKSNRKGQLSSKINLRSLKRNLQGKIGLRSNLSSHQWRMSTMRSRVTKSRNLGKTKLSLTRIEEP